MSEQEKIEVFFISGHRATFDVRTPFVSNGIGATYEAIKRTGALINWDAVAWIRIVKRGQEDD